MRRWLGAALVFVAACSKGGLDEDVPDEAEDLLAADLGEAPRPDLAQPDLLPAAKDEVLATGAFSKGGSASLVRRASGALELAFSAGFFVDPQMPLCPSSPPDEFSVVLLTGREEVPAYDARYDLEVGPLKSFTGVQTYPLPEGSPVGRPYVHIFCRPNPMLPLKPFTMSRAMVRLP